MVGRWAGLPTVDVLLPHDDTPLAPAERASAGTAVKWKDLDPEWPRPIVNLPVIAASSPRALAWRPREGTLLLVGEGNHLLFELDPHALDPSSLPRRTYPLGGCGAPSGIAVSADDCLAYVLCRSTDQLAVVTLAAPGAPGPDAGDVLRLAPLGEGPRDPLVAQGRRLFYTATDDTLTDAMACAGCHPDGRDDGFTWDEAISYAFSLDTFFADPRGSGGLPRQTPMLAGRVAAAGPYGWVAESKTLVDRIVAGYRLHRRAWFVYFDNGDPPDQTVLPKARALAAFLRSGLVPPPRHAGELTEVEQRGKALFESAAVGCTKCHSGAEHTDRMPVILPRPKPSPPPPGVLPEDDSTPDEEHARRLGEPWAGYRTPSLLFVGGTPPYFHDGSEPTLEALIEHDDDHMGKTRQLDAEGRAALVAYLRTL